MEAVRRCVAASVLLIAAGCFSKPVAWTSNVGDADPWDADHQKADGLGDVPVPRTDGDLDESEHHEVAEADVKDAAKAIDVADAVVKDHVDVHGDGPEAGETEDAVEQTDLAVVDVDTQLGDAEVEACQGDADADADSEDFCTPNCEGKVCGDDGCGGICGVCVDGDGCTVQECLNYACFTLPLNCDDTNAATVDSCDPVTGECVHCLPDCGGKECGDDGCGGSCGECGDGMVCTAAVCKCNDGNSVLWDGCNNGEVSEFQVTYAGGSNPSAATFEDGRFIVAWHGWSGDDEPIFGQLYDGSGNRNGSQFPVSTSPLSGVTWVSTATFPDGGFLVMWAGWSQDAAGNVAVMRRYDADGMPEGDESLIQPDGFHLAPKSVSVAPVADGSCVLAWSGYVPEEPGCYGPNCDFDIFAQLHDAGGNVQGDVFQVNTHTQDQQADPAVAGLPGGSFVVVWESGGQDGDGNGVFGQRFDADGSKAGDEFQVNAYTAGHQKRAFVASSGDGSFAVAWESCPDTVVDTPPQDGSGCGVFGRIYAPDGTPQAAEFQVNTCTKGHQDRLSLAALSNGGFLVVWESGGQQDGDGGGIFGQRYAAGGTVDGGEFQVNTYAADLQNGPFAAAFVDGRALVAWASVYSDSLDGHVGGVFAQLYDAEGRRIYPVKTPECGNGCLGGCGTCSEGQMCVEGSCLLEGMPCDDGNDIPWDGCTGGQVTEFQVNAEVSNNQWYPAVAAFADGRFVAAWQSHDEDGSKLGVFARLYAADGSADGAEFNVSGDGSGSQSPPSLATSDDGTFAVVWAAQYTGQESGTSNILARLCDADGTPLGETFQVNTYSYFAGSRSRPSAASIADGGFVVVWMDNVQDGSDTGVFGRRYQADAVPDGGEFQVNSHVADSQMFPAVASLGGSGFVAVWQSCPPWTAQVFASEPQDGSGCGVFGQRYDPAGAADGPEFQVNAHTSGHQKHPSVAGLDEGRFVVAWQSWAQDSEDFGVFGQQFNSDGSKIGDEFQVNAYAVGAQELPRVSSLGDDHFVVVWQSFDQDGLGFGVFGQRYDADGTKSGVEFPVNTYAVDHQSAPGVAAFGAGGFVTIWQGKWQDGDHWGIFAQRFGPDGSKSYH